MKITLNNKAELKAFLAGYTDVTVSKEKVNGKLYIHGTRAGNDFPKSFRVVLEGNATDNQKQLLSSAMNERFYELKSKLSESYDCKIIEHVDKNGCSLPGTDYLKRYTSIIEFTKRY